MKWITVFSLAMLIFPVLGRAETVEPAPVNNAAAAVPVSTAPVSVAITGETISSSAPVAMTDRGYPGVFVTLTRSTQSVSDLPFNTEAAAPDLFKIYNAQNAGDAVRRLTGISVAPTGELGTARLAGIRGATPHETLILVDGRPVGGAGLSGSQDLAEIPDEQIDHIEIVRGGMSALYGPNAVGGVINVITKRAAYTGLPVSHVGYEPSSFAHQKYFLDFGSRHGPLDFFFFGNQQWESGFRDNSDARTHNIGGNFGYSMGGGGKLLFDAASYHANAGMPGQLIPELPTNQYNNHAEKTAATPDARQTTDTNYLRASYLLPLPLDSIAAFRLFGSEREVQYGAPSSGIALERREQNKGGEAQFNLPLGLLAGGTFIRDRLDSGDLAAPSNNYIASMESWGLFIQDNLVWKTCRLIPSARYDHNDRSGVSMNPRLELIQEATPWLRLSGSAAHSFRTPALDELFTPFTSLGDGLSYQGNPNLLPEKAWVYDAGFEVHEDSYSFRAGYFRADVTDLIQRTSAANATTVNVSRARRHGAEVEVTHVYNRYYRHTWNYTYLHNEGIPPGFTNYVPLRLSPHHMVNYVGSYTPNKKWRFDNTIRYVSSRFEGNNEGNGPDESPTKIRDYFICGLRGSYQLRQMELYVGIENLTNQHYEERAGYPLPGITLFGGMALRLWG